MLAPQILRRRKLLANNVGGGLVPSLHIDFSAFQNAPDIFTYTRATTATVEDFEGLIKSCLSGELRVQGARRVRNLLQVSSEDMSALVATGTGAAAPTVTTNQAIAPDGTLTADRVVFPAVTAGQTSKLHNNPAPIYAGRSLRNSIYLRGENGGEIVNLISYGSSYETVQATLTTAWQRFVGLAYVASGASYIQLGFEASAPGTQTTAGVTIYAWGGMQEDVTGQANQNPSEYVSVGTLSFPYHGYFVDGVKYFSTLNGNTVASNVVTEAQGAAITGTIGYLAEGARTNLCLQSQVLGTTWSFTDATQSANQAVAPDGTTTMDSLIEGSGVNTFHQTYQTIAASNNTQYTFSVFLKAGTRSFVLVQIGTDTAVNRYGALVNLSDGTVTTRIDGSPTVTSNKVTQLPNGIYRVEVSAFNTSGTINVTIALSNSATPTYTAYGLPHYTGDGASLAYAWGSQLEAAAFASTYIPTTTTAVARNADVLTCPFAGIANSAQGSCYAEVTYSANKNFNMFVATNTAAATGAMLYGNSGGNLLLVDSAAQVTATGATMVAGSTIQKIASSWGGTQARFARNGTSYPASTTFSGDIGSTIIAIGTRAAGEETYGVIRAVKIYKTALSAAQLASLTS